MFFIDRKEELSFLEEKWNEHGPQLIVLWGKRRVGKTELVKQFIKNKPHIYFLGESTSNQEQLKRFSNAIARFFKEPLLETRGFMSWEEIFQYLKSKNERLILVIDEFPYLILSNSAVPSLFQKGWDEFLSQSRIYTILLGSSIGMMENEVLSYRAPLYGRCTGQWRIEPMTFTEYSKFRGTKSLADRLCHYALAGGIPAYWFQLSEKNDFFQNLRERVLRKGQILYDEVEFILREELREPRYYFALLQAIAQGKRKLSEICNATGIHQPTANKYLGILSGLHLIRREIPVTEDKPLKSKKGLYYISDEFFLFWFKYIFPKRGEIEMDRAKDVIEDIKKDLQLHLGLIYERISREILLNSIDHFFPFSALGKWWDKNEEIDIVALNKETDSILFGEVKWSRKLVGINVYESLKQKAQMVNWGTRNRKEYYCLFSKSGFTKQMHQIAKNQRVSLCRGEKWIHIR